MRRDPGVEQRLHRPLELLQLGWRLEPLQAGLGIAFVTSGQGSIHGMFPEDEDAISTTERRFECWRLLIIVGDGSLFTILKGSDIKMKMYFKIVKKVLVQE